MTHRLYSTAHSSNATRPEERHPERVGRRELAVVILLTLLGLILRLIHLHTSTGGEWSRLLFPDEANYFVAGARLIREQGWKFFTTDRSLWNAPLPALWLLAFGLRVAAVKLANLVLLSGAGLLAWDLARRRFGQAAGLIALALCSLHLPLVDLTPTILSEPPFTFLLMLSIWAAARWPQRAAAWATAGVVAGLAALTRPAIQVWPLLLAPWLLFAARSERRANVRCTHRWAAAAVLCGFLAIVGPYVLKNAVLLGRPVIANGAGAVLYLGNDLRRDGDEPVYSGFEFDTGAITAPFSHLDSEGDRRLLRRGVEMIRARPLEIMLLTARKAVRVAVGEPSSYLFPARDLPTKIRREGWRPATRAVLTMLTTITATVLGGLALLMWGRGPLTVLTGSAVAVMWLVHTVLFPLPRYFVPVFPILAVWAGGFLGRLLLQRNPSRSESVAFLLGPVAVILLSAAMCLWNVGRPREVVPARTVSYFHTISRADRSQATTHDLSGPTKTLVVSGEHPSLTLPVRPFACYRNTVVFVKLAAQPASRHHAGLVPAELSWAAADSPGTAGSLPFALVVDGRQHTYRLVVGGVCHSRVDVMSIEFPNLGAGVTLRLRDLRVAR